MYTVYIIVKFFSSQVNNISGQTLQATIQPRECLCIHWKSHICWQVDILWATIRNAICSVPWQTGFKNLMGLNAGGFSPALPSPLAPIPMIFWLDLGSALWLYLFN